MEIDEGRLWSFLRDVLSQGMAIQEEKLAGRYDSFEAISARLDDAARERVKQFAARVAPRQGASTR